MSPLQKLVVARPARLLRGHPWVFSNELQGSPRDVEPGQIVELVDRHDRFLAVAYANPKSLICARVLRRDAGPIDQAFVSARLQAALDARAAMRDREGLRLFFGEADGLPGLVIDRYADSVVLQLQTQGMERLRPLVLHAVNTLLAPRCVVLRNDGRARELEGLPRNKEVVQGSADPWPEIEELGVHFAIDMLGGQKTGFFLDQHDNRVLFSLLAQGGKALDLFSYSGAWSLHLARAGLHVTAVDVSATALAQLSDNAQRNHLQDWVQCEQADVLQWLPQAANEGRRYDAVVVDPPAFAKNKKQIKTALRAYRKLNALAFGLLRPAGLVATSSCSYHVGREAFVEMCRQAARDASCEMQMLELRGQAADHPVPLHFEQAEYLCCAILRRR